MLTDITIQTLHYIPCHMAVQCGALTYWEVAKEAACAGLRGELQGGWVGHRVSVHQQVVAAHVGRQDLKQLVAEADTVDLHGGKEGGRDAGSCSQLCMHMRQAHMDGSSL